MRDPDSNILYGAQSRKTLDVNLWHLLAHGLTRAATTRKYIHTHVCHTDMHERSVLNFSLPFVELSE